jgi:hypothetical protein
MVGWLLFSCWSRYLDGFGLMAPFVPRRLAMMA